MEQAKITAKLLRRKYDLPIWKNQIKLFGTIILEHVEGKVTKPE